MAEYDEGQPDQPFTLVLTREEARCVADGLQRSAAALRPRHGKYARLMVRAYEKAARRLEAQL